MVWRTLILPFFLAAPAGEDLPRPAARDVDFLRDVAPLLERSCKRCHAGGKRRGGFRFDTREDLLEGGKSGPAVVPGRSGESLLVELVAGRDPERLMPAKGDRLSAEEIGLLRAWIDEGAPWPAGFSFSSEASSGLALRRPPLPAPAGGESEHPVDRLIRADLAAKGIELEGRAAGDRLYARRVHLDIIGLLPREDELEEFLEDDQPDKRRRLVLRLLSDRFRYAEHWLGFWNDALRNDYRGTGYIDGGRKQISDWLYRALVRNLPYDEFVRQLVDPSPASEGFLKGIVWRGVVNASQKPEMQAAQNVSQVFLGINLKCASCHDSFINEWKLDDAYGLANVFAEKPLEVHRCDKPQGRVAPTKFLYPELGTIDGERPREERLSRLATLLTSPENGRFARTIVNRLWARFFGRGLVEPVDDMDAEAWSQELLDWLAADLVDHGYDLKHTIERILTSRAYQLESVGAIELEEDHYVFRGPRVRRLSAEQFADAVSQLTGVARRDGPSLFPAWFLERIEASERGLGDRVPEPPGAPPPGHAFLRYASDVISSGSVDVDIDIEGAETLWLVAADAGDGNRFDWAVWAEPRLEGPKGVLHLTELPWRSARSGHGKVQLGKNPGEEPIRLGGRPVERALGTHAFSTIVWDLPEGYSRFRATFGPDGGAVEKSAAGHTLRFVVMTDIRRRAALVPADPLLRALGRPNREQVVTRRDSAATTLQALELTNGDTLDDALRRGAERWLEEMGGQVAGEDVDNALLVERLFLRALGRRPTASESRVAAELVGSPPSPEGVQDLLWVIVMLPEFQLIY